MLLRHKRGISRLRMTIDRLRVTICVLLMMKMNRRTRRNVVLKGHSVEKKVHDCKMHEVEEVVPQKRDYCTK